MASRCSNWCKISSIRLIISKYNYSFLFRILWLNKIKDLPKDVFSKLSTLKYLYVYLCCCCCLKLCPKQTNGAAVCLVSSFPTNIAISSIRLTFFQIFRNQQARKITNKNYFVAGIWMKMKFITYLRNYFPSYWSWKTCTSISIYFLSIYFRYQRFFLSLDNVLCTYWIRWRASQLSFSFFFFPEGRYKR